MILAAEMESENISIDNWKLYKMQKNLLGRDVNGSSSWRKSWKSNKNFGK